MLNSIHNDFVAKTAVRILTVSEKASIPGIMVCQLGPWAGHVLIQPIEGLPAVSARMLQAKQRLGYDMLGRGEMPHLAAGCSRIGAGTPSCSRGSARRSAAMQPGTWPGRATSDQRSFSLHADHVNSGLFQNPTNFRWLWGSGLEYNLSIAGWNKLGVSEERRGAWGE